MNSDIVKWLWEQRDEIRKGLRVLSDWFQRPGSEQEAGPGILVLGAGGTGKTTLAKFLSGSYDFLLSWPGRYKESREDEIDTLPAKDDIPEVDVLVPPGQQHERPRNWDDLLHNLEGGEYKGLILVSAYGHHSLGALGYKHLPLYKGDKEEFLRAFLDDRREAELSILRTLVPRIQRNRRPMWMLSVITKEDLWWPLKEAVHRHYMWDDYKRELDTLLKNKDSKAFRHEFAFTSLTISNYRTGLGELLKENTAGYDHELQIESLRRLLEFVDALRRWELT